MRCHYVRGYGGERVLVPACWGNASREFGEMSMSHCECARPSRKSLEDRIEDVEKRLKALEARSARPKAGTESPNPVTQE